MTAKGFASVTDQVTEHLRQGMLEARWQGALPGRKQLARELGCSESTVVEATQRLTREGLLVSPGPGHRRRIVLPERVNESRVLRVRILLYEKSDHTERYMLELVHRLQEAGHGAAFAEKTMHDLGMNVKRIARFVEGIEADAWIVLAGSRDVLEWFSGYRIPAFALFGRLTKVPLASSSPKKADALVELVDRLVDLGHRRIVLLTREERRKPTPGFLEQLFLDRLAEHGIATGLYNLPDWDDSPEGLRRIIDSLIQRTPPTALIIGQPMLFFAVMQHLATLGMSAPRHVSLACMDADTTFNWGHPSVTHLAWDFNPIINRVVKWAGNISHGKDDRRKHASKATLVLGGTIGPAPKGK